MLKQIIKRLFLLNVIFLFLMSVYRIIFTFYYAPAGLEAYRDGLVKAFILGIRYDAAVLAYINSFAVLAFIIFIFKGSKKVFLGFMNSLKYYYTFFFGSVILILCIDFGFYSYFQNHINILIFGVFEDDTKALFSTLAKNYPLALVAAGFIAVFVVIYFLSKRILEKNIGGFYLEKIKPGYKILICLLLAGITFITARGSFKMFPLGVDDSEIANNAFINKVGINALYTLQAAFDARLKENRGMDYIAKMGYSKEDPARIFSDYLNIDVNKIDKNVPEKSLERKTKYNKAAEEIKPNVILIVMESLGTDLMHYDSPTFNVLGEFKKHMDQDITFYNFMPGHIGTIGSLEAVITNIQRMPSSKYLSQSKYAYNKYFFSGPMPYKNNNYETVFMYGGNAGWRNSGSYMPNLGFDLIMGEGSMSKEYERNEWGIYDEYLFENIFKVLEKNDNKKFIYVLTTSNHPPYTLPSEYKKMPLEITEELKNDITGDMKLSEMRFAAYQYACQKAGEFLTKLKKSKYADNTIVAITGDHNFWSVFSYTTERKLDMLSVPFYLYIPERLKPDVNKIDTKTFGSHSDIMPTLYELSLSNTVYWAVGKNLLSPEASNNTASNDVGLIANQKYAVLYNFNSDSAKSYSWNKDKPREIVPCAQTKEHETMLKHYKSGVAIAQYMLKNDRAIIK